jgi:hypothetical protein
MSNVTMKSNSLYIYKRTCPLNKMRGYWSFIMKQILFNGIHVFSNRYKLSRLGFDLRNCYGIYLSRMTTMCSGCRRHNAVLSSCMVYRRICNKSHIYIKNYLPFRIIPWFLIARYVILCAMVCGSLFVIL